MVLCVVSVVFFLGLLLMVDWGFLGGVLLFVSFVLVLSLSNKVFGGLGLGYAEFKVFNSLFVLFLVSNLLGLSSLYLSLTLFPFLMVLLSFIFWLRRIFNLLRKSVFSLVSHFALEDLNLVMCCCMVFIEVIRVFIRSITLAFRLLANLLGGHLMLELGSENTRRYLVLIGVRSYEVFVSIIQAVIFSILLYYYSLESIEKY